MTLTKEKEEEANKGNDKVKCLFIIRVDNGQIYYCGNGNDNENTFENTMARSFFNMFKIVYLPFGFSIATSGGKYCILYFLIGKSN